MPSNVTKRRRVSAAERGRVSPSPSKKTRGGKSSTPRASKTPDASPVGDNFLSKLRSLREFVGPSHNESDLSLCLRRCGYDVGLAAERILTGDWTPTTRAKSFSKHDAAPSLSSPPVSVAGEAGEDQKARVGGRAVASSSSARGVGGSSPASDRRESSVNGDGDGGVVAGRRKCESVDSGGRRSPEAGERPPTFLLCRRWTVATCTVRGGRVDHRERLGIEDSHPSGGFDPVPDRGGGGGGRFSGATGKASATALVRLRGRSVRCTLNRRLCSLLGPLLGGGGERGRDIVTVRAETLMEDRHLTVGSEVPLELSVYLTDAKSFLALVPTAAASSSSSGARFAKDLMDGSVGNRGQPRRDAARGGAAFGLLQWAQYGDDMPSFDLAETNGRDSDRNLDGGADEQAKPNGPNEGKADVDPDEAEQEAAQEEETSPDWAEGLYKDGQGEGERAGAASPSIPEAPDPAGFKPEVRLRAYQRQALRWMMDREAKDGGASGDSMQEQLEFLSGLASDGLKRGISPQTLPPLAFDNGRAEVVTCDCGPVLVSPRESLSCPSLDGSVEPHLHPLWTRRFLAEERDGGGALVSARAFYVNELLGTASSCPPPAPRPCRGGVLADAMGLGKTVMLLALILGVKEKEEGGGGVSGDVASRVARTAATPSSPSSTDGAICLSSDEDEENDDNRDSDYDSLDGQGKEKGKRKVAGGKIGAAASSSSSCGERFGTTLVVAPLSLLSQWEEEIASKTCLSHRVHYGSGGPVDGFHGVDLVVTTCE